MYIQNCALLWLSINLIFIIVTLIVNFMDIIKRKFNYRIYLKLLALLNGVLLAEMFICWMVCEGYFMMFLIAVEVIGFVVFLCLCEIEKRTTIFVLDSLDFCTVILIINSVILAMIVLYDCLSHFSVA